MKRVIVALCLLAGSIFAQPLKYTANYGRTDYASQFHVYSSVLNTPTIEFSLFQGTNAYTPSAGTGVYFAYGKSDSDPSMRFIYGSLTNAKAVIQVASNDFPIQVDGWYAALVLTSSVQNLSVRGQISIRRSPEISSPGVLSKTYAVNGSEYGPFTGTFSSWPFVEKDAGLGLLVTNAVINQGISAQPWSSFPATQNVRFVSGSGVTNLNHIAFNTSPSGTLHAGRIQWSAARSSPQIQLNDNVIVDWGTTVIYTRSTETNTITKGEVVILNGAFSDQPTVKRASNASEALSARTIGIAAENISSNSSGFIVTGGTVYNIPTTNYTAGAVLYLGANGTLQTNLPAAPLHGVFIGTVERVHANAGQIFVHIQNYQEIEELSDVNASSRTTNDLLIWNGTVWTNYSRTNFALQSSLAGYLPLAGGTMGGNIDMNALVISNVFRIGGTSSVNIDFDAEEFEGPWTFDTQPTIPGYQTITGTVNAANITNASVLGFATTARVANVEAYTNRAAGAVQRTGDVVNGSFALDEVSTVSLATNYPLILKHRAFDASSLNTMIAATTNGLRRTTTGQGSATIWDSLNSSFATGTPVYAESDPTSVTNVTASGRLTATRTGKQVALTFDATGLATGTPIYSASGLATGTPIYSVAGLATGSPVYSVTYLETNVASRLSSNVWASADSTTNYQSRVQFVSASNSLSSRIGAVSNAVRGGTYGSYTNDILIGEGEAYLLGKYSRKLSLSGLDEGAVSRTASIRYLPYGGIDYLYYDGEFGSEVLLMSNNNIVAARLTNELNNIYIREANLSQYGVSSVSVTGPVAGAIYIVGSGISQTNTTLNFDGYLSSTSAAAEYISKTGAVFAGNVDIDENNLVNVDNIDGFGRRIAFDGGTFTGAWTFAQAPTIPSFVNTNNLSTIAGFGLGVTSNKLVVTNIASTFESLTGNRMAIGGASITNMSVAAYGGIIAGGTAEGADLFINFGYGSSFSGTTEGTNYMGIYSIGNQQIGAFGASSSTRFNDYVYGGLFRGANFGTAVITSSSSDPNSVAYGATQIGYLPLNSFAYNNGAGAIQLMGGTVGTYLTTTNADGSILLGPGTNNVAYSILANGPIESLNSIRGNHFGNASNLTNFPASLLTVSAGNTNYWRITTAPSTSTAAGSYGQAAISGTNMFFYNHLSNKWLRVNGTLEW